MDSIFKTRGCLTQREVKQYLDDKLSDEQRYDVENHLLDCALCSAAVDGYAQHQGIEPAEEDIELIRKQVSASARSASRPRLAWINRAAAAALVLIVGYAAFLYWSNSQAERLFTAYFEAAPNSYITYRSAEEREVPEELKLALEYYDEGNFTLALPHFENYLEGHQDDRRALILTASALLQAGRAKQAEAYLLRLEGEDAALQQQAAWYLSLAYLRQGKIPQAREKLEKIRADEASPFRERAREILEKIE